MLYIVSGPTSVGKSTFIESVRCAEITGLSSETPVTFPKPSYRSLLDEGNATDLLYHYNILRPQSLLGKEPLIRSATDFGHDPQWNDLTKREMAKKAIVLVSSRQTILQRIRQRKVREDLLSQELRNRRRKPYNVQRWLNLLEQVDLVALYQAWCRELQANGIPYVLVDGTDDTYPIIESDDDLPTLVDGADSRYTKEQVEIESDDYPPTYTNGADSSYTKEQIEKILRERRFRYHRVDLPFGLHTGGADRSATRDIIFPKSLEGKTVLDVGCALGYFCFEAEAKGAARVVGVEPKPDRFSDAMLLKDIKGSKVDFLQRDIILNPLDEHFDYVFLLNVIHHLKEPFRAIRQLASITRERLVIEFPTFADRKFRKTANLILPFLYNRLPLVGVSSMPQAKQTFVFTPSAITRALTDHERLFKKVEILRSPMPGRAIAICHKQVNFE